MTSADLIYRSAARGESCWARNHHGQIRALPITRWMGGPNGTEHDRLADEYIVEQCTNGLTLDLGCGPGRFAAALQQRGRASLGVDSSTTAVNWTRRRGGVAIVGDVFDPLPGPGCWDHVLLADGNIGIGGDPVAILRRAAEMLATGGVVIVEVDQLEATVSREFLRWETDDHIGHWFAWSRVGTRALGLVAQCAGLTVDTVVDVHSRVIAVLAPIRLDPR